MLSSFFLFKLFSLKIPKKWDSWQLLSLCCSPENPPSPCPAEHSLISLWWVRGSNICAAPTLGAELLRRLQRVVLAGALQPLPNCAPNGTWPRSRERWPSAGAACHASNYTMSLHLGQRGWHLKTEAFHKNDCSETASERELPLCLLQKRREPDGVGITWDGAACRGPCAARFKVDLCSQGESLSKKATESVSLSPS